MIHWSHNKDHLVVYHGTHVKNVPAILKNGINNKDPKTGMVSVAIGSHGQNIAHGYAAMSGEYGFRQAGQKAVVVPHENRAIVVAHLPMDWVHKNVDRNFGGNPTDIKQRLSDPKLHRQHVAKTGSDFSPTETPELRFKEAIPAKYIVDVMQKRKPMKSFREFSESTARSAPPGAYANDPHEIEWLKNKISSFKDEYVSHTLRQGSKHNTKPRRHREIIELEKQIKEKGGTPDNHNWIIREDVPPNSMSASSPSAISNPNNNMLFKKIKKRKPVTEADDRNMGLEKDPGQSEPERRSEYHRTHKKRRLRRMDD